MIRLETGHHTLLIVGEGDDDHEVWLDTEVQDFDGVSIGSGKTRSQAIEDARQALQAALAVLGGAA